MPVFVLGVDAAHSSFLPDSVPSRMPASSLCPILCLIGFDGRLQPYIHRKTITDAEAGEAVQLGDHQAANY